MTNINESTCDTTPKVPTPTKEGKILVEGSSVAKKGALVCNFQYKAEESPAIARNPIKNQRHKQPNQTKIHDPPDRLEPTGNEEIRPKW
eukprot:5079037-Amphidinium_carterae.1